MNNELARHIHSFVRNMATAVSSASLYAIDHPQVVKLCEGSIADLENILANRPEISLLIIDNELVSEGVPLDHTLYASRFAAMLKARGIGHIKVTAGITVRELVRLVSQLRKGGGAIEIKSTEHLRFGNVQVRYSGSESDDGGIAEMRTLPVFSEMPDEELHRLMEIYDGVQRHRKLNINGVEQTVSNFINIFKEQLDPLLAISPLKSIDQRIFTHSANVCILNLAQAMALGIDGQMLRDIGIAAMLHDTGKLLIPEEILLKPGPLDDSEWEIMKLHPVHGAHYLLDTQGVPQLAVITAFEHHLGHDLSGYPRVHAGWTQHICSEITTISDYFDAMRSKRACRDVCSYEDTASQMLGMSGTQFHPLLLKNFLGILNKATKI